MDNQNIELIARMVMEALETRQKSSNGLPLSLSDFTETISPSATPAATASFGAIWICLLAIIEANAAKITTGQTVTILK